MLTQFNHYRKRLPSFFLLCAATFFLSACGFQWPEWGVLNSDPLFFLGDSGDNGPDTPPPPNVMLDDVPDQTDPESEFMATSTMGVNLETYFLQDIQDPVTRIQRLENVILAMHKDLQYLTDITPPRKKPLPVAAAPPPRIVSQQAGTQPVSLTAQPGQPSSVAGSSQTPYVQPPSQPRAPTSYVPPSPQQTIQNYYEPAQVPRQPSVYSPPPPASPVAQQQRASITPQPVPVGSGSGVVIKDLRIGEHAHKMRIVLDITDKTAFRADLDNSERLLVIEMPNAQWQKSARSKTYSSKLPLLKSYRVDPFNNGQGQIVVIELKQGTSILEQRMYPAFSGPGERIVVDLQK